MNKKQLLPIIIFTAIVGSIITTQTVVAQTEEPSPLPILHYKTDILGFTPIEITIIITAIGVGGRTLMSIGKNPKSFSMLIMGQSLFVGFLSSVALVSASVANIHVDVSELDLFSILIGQIVLVAGIDKGVRDAQASLSLPSKNPIMHWGVAPNNNPIPITRPKSRMEEDEEEYHNQASKEMEEILNFIDEEEEEELPPGKETQ